MTPETFTACRRCLRLTRALTRALIDRVGLMHDRDDLETYLVRIGHLETYVVWRDMRRSHTKNP